MSQQHLSNVSVEIASCEGDITFFAKRYDSDTRQWFFDDFDKWFRDPGDSRAYVLLGDPGVGKSVIAGVMAQRMRKAGHLGAAYFCRHNDGTRNDPRYLLGTVARQLCDCNTQYRVIIGGESGVKMLLGNSKLGVRELFTKLVQEPLSKCSPCDQKKLVIIDALDETEYESREDFLDLIMHCFPLLPEWLVFFITSRPEDSVQFRLKKYNPCVKICAGNSDQDNFYQQHEQDIQTFLKNKIDFSRLSVTVEDISKKCNGLFLYAHYIVDELRLSADSGKEVNQLSDLFPGDIDSFFLQNFKRVYDQVGQNIFKKLFGCTIVAPASRLPVSIISYILKREKSNCDEQQVIDAVSQFVVLRISDQTLTFLHNLIPAWLTDRNKASRKLFIYKDEAGEYLRKVFVEILAYVVNKPPTGPSIDVDLKDYVSRVGVRFLCENGAKDLLKVAFASLTNYHFIEGRMKYGKIEIYRLLEDFRLAASRFALEEVSKQEILQEILLTIESNVLVLLECPHLLHSCIRNASNAVQQTVSIPQVALPWLEWISNFRLPIAVDANITNMHCFATAPNKRTVAGAEGRSLQFFDLSTVEKVSDPFDLSNDTIDSINHLEYSPDGKFLFFGRLDKWFSVDRGCVEDFPQFSGNSHVYKWGVLTRDGQYIVVKKGFLSCPSTCERQSCVFNLLALWALKEIELSGDDEMTASFCPDGLKEMGPCSEAGVHIKRLFERLGLREILGEGDILDDPSCYYCCRLRELTQSNQEPSLASVRQLVIKLYPCIFEYQVWDLETGMPLLQQVFSADIQFNPFTYFCHVFWAYSEVELKKSCSGIWKAMSRCNIATVTAYCYFRSVRQLESNLETLVAMAMSNSSLMKKIEDHLEKTLGENERKLELEVERKTFHMHALESFFREAFERKRLENLDDIPKLRKIYYFCKWALMGESEGHPDFLSPELFREVHNDAFKIGLWRNIPEGFQNLPDSGNRKVLSCVSPQMKWVIQADDSLQVSLLQTGNQEEHHIHHEKTEYTFSKSTRFTFSNDDLFFVYQSPGGSLRALSFKTGEVLSSVSGNNVGYFTRERQVGYLFRHGTEETAIFLTSLFSPFKFLPAQPVKPLVVGKSVAAMFCSSNAVISVSSDSTVTVMQTSTSADKEFIPFGDVCIGWSTVSGPQSLAVKNCAVSSNGRLIAIHLEGKLELYGFIESKLEFLHSKCECMVTCFAFSSDGTALLLCTQDSENDSYFHVWDIQEEVVSARLESRVHLTPECCCLSSDKVVLCGDYEIEIWEYAEHTCRLIARRSVARPYISVRFSQCSVSVDNQFLVCCIADVILVYSLGTSNIYSSKQVLRGHLGIIEFCRFLKINRYLISYAVDGMVFLWDISEAKAAGFSRIVEGQESIVSLAVSPEEDRAVCFTSTGRVCMIKLCELGSALELKPFTAPVKIEPQKTAETSLQSLDIADSWSCCDFEDSYFLEDLDESD
ncbi:uncharacterized protein LOC110061513 [Orbicella faveolata]|uniref:uncharacterized protein LOC110061513 n=1 Tax=Orbicella faveolata TaxID=48498 RepID=UPI0009E52942|nr:uncharacterized protein LOC110061513 [Orbicella faveolata]